MERDGLRLNHEWCWTKCDGRNVIFTKFKRNLKLLIFKIFKLKILGEGYSSCSSNHVKVKSNSRFRLLGVSQKIFTPIQNFE
jgi:hypothetical protein